MQRFIASALLASLFFLPTASHAQMMPVKQDDVVAFTLSAEGWVNTQTARVTMGVEAAVTGSTAGTMRANMTKAISDIVKADWRLVSFNRGQDSTGMERWSAIYEARVPEAQLGGLNEKAKQASKAGMQINVADIDFSPTLEETQATMAQLRAQIYKQANEQLATLNTAIQGRNYRIGQIAFGDAGTPPMPVRAFMAKARGPEMMTMASPSGDPVDSSMQRSEKIVVSAHVIYSAAPPALAK